jgi:hypothetical protein
MSPRTVPAGVKQRQRGSAGDAVAILVDVQVADGAVFHWSDFAGVYPVRLGAGPNAAYSAWVKSAGDFQSSRASKSDSGNFVVQNLSGNSIDRDVAALLKGHEFEGALACVRFWDRLEDGSIDEFQGVLTEPEADDDQVQFRMVQLCDPNQAEIATDVYSETCTLRFKEVRCGSTSPNLTCSKRFIDCTAVERFNGTPGVPPGSQQVSPIVQIGNGLGGGEPAPELPFGRPQKRGL